ncbi:MAG: DNA polymerase III subunit gamma/tau [Gammaproteobacteria bacterium]|nr:DNA polymerase III subunit gamma/tau [Gammaproteobacteria bacterium]
MSYQALARKWRPKNLSDVVGQPHVVKALTAALDAGRIHPAYLFSGTRGVGKTTLARIIARSLNCEKGVSSNPCGLCQNCLAIVEGHFFDLIEVDGASRTKVEETKSLLENVPYAPAQGRYKVYLIDEVHMLSTHSFNALLKTLEEPPPHVIFILATTEPTRLPATVLSRCLQFYLKPVELSAIVARLTFVLEQEHFSYDLQALFGIAKAARGSLRDALSLLEHALLMSQGRLEEEAVYAITGGVPEEHVLRLLEAIIQGDAESLMQYAAEIAEFSPQYEEVLAELLSLLQKIAVLQFAPSSEAVQGVPKPLLAFAKKLSPEETQLYYQIALLGQRDLELSSHKASGFEMLLLRMLVFRPVKKDAVAVHAGTPIKTESEASSSQEALVKKWPDIVKQLKLTGMAEQLLAHATLKRKEGKTIELALSAASSPLLNERVSEQVKTALSDYFGEAINLCIMPSALENIPEASKGETPKVVWERERKTRLESDLVVQNFLETFEGKVQI